VASSKRNGQSYVFKFLASGDPLAAGATAQSCQIARYLLAEGDKPPMEYWDGWHQTALLPCWGFVEELVPECSAGESFLQIASYLGWQFRVVESDTSGARSVLGQPERLLLDPGLLVGTGRPFRDDRTGRRWDGSEYEYVAFDEADFREMLAAGVNYFNFLSAEQEEIGARLAAWYTRAGTDYQYPEVLYRSNFRGTVMFVDEPGILFPRRAPEEFRPGASVTPEATPQAYAQALEEYQRDRLNDPEAGSYSHYSFQRALDHTAKPTPRAIEFFQPDIPNWEVQLSTAWYACHAGAAGVVQEGRWELEKLRRFNALLDGQIPVTAENLLRIDFANLRGAARCFDTWWGTAVYGQADPAIARQALLLAYDLGVRYLWYWTSDHGHHLPYDEQLNYTRLLRQHQQQHPKRDMAALRRKATVAIALPYGYGLGLDELTRAGLLGNSFFHLDRTNREGQTYREVLHTAALEVERCLREGMEFDLVVDHSVSRAAGYDTYVAIGKDASVCVDGEVLTEDRTPTTRQVRQ